MKIKKGNPVVGVTAVPKQSSVHGEAHYGAGKESKKYKL